MGNHPKSWHKEVIPEAAERVLEILTRSKMDSFYLAGGTGLALRLGHRLSRDLDFFSAEPFSEEMLLGNLKDFEKLSVVSKDWETLHLHILDIKVSFLGYHYPVLFPFGSFMGMQIADPRDIACMKINAIAGRGSRRDFVDLYFIAKEYGLGCILDLFRKKYSEVDINLVHVLKSMTYFKDAETEPMPKMLTDISWDEIANFFKQESPKLI
jgi:hypothetical protein